MLYKMFFLNVDFIAFNAFIIFIIIFGLSDRNYGVTSFLSLLPLQYNLQQREMI